MNIKSSKFAVYEFLSKFIPYFKKKFMESEILDKIERILESYFLRNDSSYHIKYKYFSYGQKSLSIPYRISFVLGQKNRQNVYELLIEYYSDNKEIQYSMYHPKRIRLFENAEDAEKLKEFYVELESLNPLIIQTFVNAKIF